MACGHRAFDSSLRGSKASWRVTALERSAWSAGRLCQMGIAMER